MKSTAQREAEKPRPSRVLSRVAHEPVNATLGIAMVIRAIMSGGADASTKYRRARALAFGFIGAATLSLVYAARELPEHLGDILMFWGLAGAAWPPLRLPEEQSRSWLTLAFIGLGLGLLMTLTGFLMSESLWSEPVLLGSALCLICLGYAVDAQRPAHVEIPGSRMLSSLAAIAVLALSLWLRLHRAA